MIWEEYIDMVWMGVEMGLGILRHRRKRLWQGMRREIRRGSISRSQKRKTKESVPP